MQHENFTYKNKLIELDHLQQKSADFVWTGDDGLSITYRIWLRYSCHPYSRELHKDEAVDDEAYVVEKNPTVRIFCPERYDQTKRLVEMMSGLLAKPTSRVSLTHENNWTTFQLYLPPEGKRQHRYCAFFRVKNSLHQPSDLALHFLDMHVESGYIRENIVSTVRACTFGNVAHMTKNGIAYK